MSELFDLRIIECKIRSQTNFSFGAVYTTKYGLTTLRYFAPKIRNITPADIRNVNNGLGLYMSIRIYKLIDVTSISVLFLKKISLSVDMLMNGIKICFYVMFLYNGVNTRFSFYK